MQVMLWCSGTPSLEVHFCQYLAIAGYGLIGQPMNNINTLYRFTGG